MEDKIIVVQNGSQFARIRERGLQEWMKMGWMQTLDLEVKKPRKKAVDENG